MINYTTNDLECYPTLSVGQADDLKVDDGQHRWWLCRCGIADGMSVESTVTVEELQDGRWVTVCTYDGDTMKELS